jgi:hypothetical protein
MNSILLLFLLFFTKHFIVDFLMQGPYQYKNKGTYGHPGGVLHAFLHGLGTLIVFFFAPIVSFGTAVLFSILDGMIHYHVDWAKLNINRKLNWGPTTSEQFWWLLGFDQYLHMLTYLGLIVLALGSK